MSILQTEVDNLFAAYRIASNQPDDPGTVRAYVRDLSVIPADVLPDVLREAREKSERFRPTIGQIMRIYRAKAQYDTHDKPQPAWDYLGMSRDAFYDRPGTPEWFRAIVAP